MAINKLTARYIVMALAFLGVLILTGGQTGHHQASTAMRLRVYEYVNPNYFRLTERTPREVAHGAKPLDEVKEDFFGNPRDPEHPSMGAIEYSGPTTAEPIVWFGQTDADETGHGVRGANALKASLFFNSALTGQLTQIDIHVAVGAPSCRVRIGIYQFTGSYTQPGSLLLNAGEIVGPVAGWNTISGLQFPVTRDEWYWIAWNCSEDLDVYHGVTNGFWYAQVPYSSGLPSQFPATSGASVNTSLRAKVSR